MEKAIFDRLKEGIVIFNKEHYIRFCNNSIIQKLGFPEEEIINKNIDKIIEFNFAHLNKEYKIKLKTSEGKKLLAVAELTSANWQDESVYVLIIKEYIDKNYSIDELEMIIENMPYAIWICDDENRYRYVNHNTINMAGKINNIHMTKEKFMKQTLAGSWEKNIEQEIIINDEKVLRQGEIISEERKAKVGEEILRYFIIKIPIMDENGEYQGMIGINKYDLFEENVEKAMSKKHISTDSKYKSNHPDEVQDVLKLSELVESMIEAEAVTVFEYIKESKQLKGIFRLGNKMSGLEEINQIEIHQVQFAQMIQITRQWIIEEFEKIIPCKGINELKKAGVKYLYLYQVEYNNEVLGATIAAYKDNLKYPSIERKFQAHFCKYIGGLLKNNQLSAEIRKEFYKRQAAEEELKLYLNLAADFIVTLDNVGKAIKWNDSCYTMLGWNDEDISKMIYRDLSHPDDYKANTDIINKGKQNLEVIEFVNRYKHKDGEYRLLRCTVKFDEEKQIFFGLGKDITEERKKEEERKAYKEALALETLKTEFLANMSHELKTPLNIIYSMLQLVELEIKHILSSQGEAVNTDNLQRYKRVTIQNVYRLLRLINNITDISRIGAGYYQAKLVDCDIIRIVEDITMSVVEYVKNKKINIIFDTEEEELVMACDPEKMERIMLNLLSNAVKYTNEGDSIWVDMKVDNDLLLICVEDNGIGIPEEKQKIIFERFVQVDTSFTRKKEGSGIGLALVKSLVEQQNGTIEVKSKLGQGTTFTVALPITRSGRKGDIGREEDNNYMDRCKVEFSDIYDL